MTENDNNHIFIEDNKKKCRIGEGCLTAVVANSGLLLTQIHGENDYGIDFEVKKLALIKGKTIEQRPYFQIQLKTTCNWQINNENIVYDLEASAYNALVSHNFQGTTKLILVVMCLHNTEEKWCSVLDHSIRFQNSLFWYYTDSEEFTNNNSSIRIHIPKTNIFNEEAIIYLANKFQIKI